MDIQDFADWLIAEMRQRGWTQAELARRSHINRQVISTYVNRQRTKPDEDMLRAIARAFGIPPEEVFRKAGLLPESTQPRTLAEQRLLYRLTDLNDAEIDEVLAFIEFIQSRSKRTAYQTTTKRKREGAAPPVTLKE